MHVVLLACVCVITLSAQKGKTPATEQGYHVIAIDRLVRSKDGFTIPEHSVGKSFVVLAYSKDGQHVLVEYKGAIYDSHKDIRNAVASAADPKLLVIDKAA